MVVVFRNRTQSTSDNFLIQLDSIIEVIEHNNIIVSRLSVRFDSGLNLRSELFDQLRRK